MHIRTMYLILAESQWCKFLFIRRVIVSKYDNTFCHALFWYTVRDTKPANCYCVCFASFPFFSSCSNATGPKCSTCVHQVFALSRSKGPHTVSPCVHTPLLPVSWVLSGSQPLTTWKISGNPLICVARRPHSPQTPCASGHIAHSFVLDPSQQESTFSPPTRGVRLDLLQLLLKISHTDMDKSPKCGVTFAFYPLLFFFFHS